MSVVIIVTTIFSLLNNCKPWSQFWQCKLCYFEKCRRKVIIHEVRYKMYNRNQRSCSSWRTLYIVLGEQNSVIEIDNG